VTNRSIALRRRLVHLAVACVPLAVGACTSSSPDSTSASPHETGETRAPLATAVSGAIRQITVRSPYGHVAATGNLVLDGDFELEQDALSAPWFVIDADGSYDSLLFGTGGQCVSGLYCAALQAGQSLLGGYVGVAPGTAGTFSFAAKPSGTCSDVQGELQLGLDAEGLVFDTFTAQPTSAAPGSDGWCRYTGTYAADRPMYQWAEVTLTSSSATLFDDVVILASSDTQLLARAQAHRRAGDPVKGRALVALRHAVTEANARRAAGVLNHRSGAGAWMKR
jgi:hypothetical protein